MEYTVYSMNNLTEKGSQKTVEGLIIFNTKEDRSHTVLNYFSSVDVLPSSVLSVSLDDADLSVPIDTNIYPETEFIDTKINTDMKSSLIPCLRRIQEYVEDKKEIGIDISVMPIPIFAQILHFLFVKYKDKKFMVYYSEPGHYKLDGLFDFTSCDGEVDIRAISGFEGKTALKNSSQRVIFYLMGFEMNYLNRMIPQQTNPDGIVPINGFPSYFPKYKDISLINNDVNYYENDVEILFAEANNPYETFNRLNMLKNKYFDFCIDIIPAGTKPMAMGACLFALKSGNNDIRILYPFPSEYKPQNSMGTGVVWEYEL